MDEACSTDMGNGKFWQENLLRAIGRHTVLQYNLIIRDHKFVDWIQQ
jgi:hypothetical protein